MDTNLRGDDPGRWGHSLANLAEFLFPLLEAAGARSVVEIGAYAGDLTQELADWAAGVGAHIVAVDPNPQPELVELSERRPELELIRRPSVDGLPDLLPADAVIIDGDHNYYTVSEELRLVEEKSAGPGHPLLLIHDVCWPHARRDAYYAPERIPADHRQPLTRGAGLFPGEPGVVVGGLPYRCVASQEGGPRNGVLTAVEDFIDGNDRLRLAIIPAFFGLGVVWDESVPWADAVAKLLGPWDRNPLLARLEANRVFHLASELVRRTELYVMEERKNRQERALRNVLASNAFAFADRLWWLRHGGRFASMRDHVKHALGEDGTG